MPKCKKPAKKKSRPKVEHSSGNVFKDIGFSDEEAESLLIRAQLLSELEDLIKSSGMSQRQLAKVLKVQQPRIAEIVGGRLELFSADLLMRLLNRFGKKVRISIHDGRAA
jgi:predicted XRE-type DNA-binding protein